MFLVILALLCVATTAAAQVPAPAPAPADALFDDTFLHEIRLTMNSRDWEALKANFQLNDTIDSHPWNGLTVHKSVRSRGLISRSWTTPGCGSLPPLVPTQTCSAAIGRPANNTRTLQPPRAHRHESVPMKGARVATPRQGFVNRILGLY